ncbi:MAG: PepSY domain-containing protein [Gemmatimonas sp.]|nr:PepSY domain-containing protein [Gemmatimonas sp.]
MKSFRQVVFWAHLLTAVCVGLVIAIMAVTGVLLTYQRQIERWADTRDLDGAPPSATAQRMDLEGLLQRVATGLDQEPTSMTWYAEPTAPVAVAFGRARMVFVNAYTGQFLGEHSVAEREFFERVIDWHRWLGRPGDGRIAGRAITGASNLALLFMVFSGFFLWWPRKWNRAALTKVVFFRRGLSPKARDFNWHHVIGLWSAVPLAIIATSGVMISYSWGTDLVYRLAEAAAPSIGSEGRAPVRVLDARTREGSTSDTRMSLTALGEVAARQLGGWQSITLHVPREGANEVAFTIDSGDGGQPQKQGRLSLDGGTGEIVRWDPFAAGTPGDRLRDLLRFTHTGEVLGPLGQTIAGLASLGATFLVWTGLSLALRRFAAWRGRQTTSARMPPGSET